MKRKALREDVTIRDLLDVIHWTVIQEEGENEKCMLSSIDNKISTGYLENYNVKEQIFWKTITQGRRNVPFVWDIKPIFIFLIFIGVILVTFALTKWLA
jgi:hypothetical protein